MFRDIESALSWAFMMASVDLVNGPVINRMFGKRPPGTRIELLQGLSKSDQQKQAQEIVQMVEELKHVDPVFRELLRAEYGKHGEIDTLVIRVIGTLGSGMHRRRGVQDIILKYCGAKINARVIRDHLQCNANKVKECETKIYDVLDRYRVQAMDLLYEKLVQKGLVFDGMKKIVGS